MRPSRPLCDRILELFLEKLHLEIASIDTDLFETGLLDSLSFVELLLNLEQEFGIKISLEHLELENFRSVSRIAQFIERCPSPEPVSRQQRARNQVA